MPWVTPVIIEGRQVRLEPLCEAHAEGLARIAEDEIFRFFAGPRPRGRDIRAGLDFVQEANEQSAKQWFAIISKATGEPVGTTSFMDIRDKHRGLEIGSTWLSPEVQGTLVNPESKLLLLTHAFETLDALRVQLRTDMRNLQSRRAIEKLGATQEGIFRSDTIMPDGYVRDSVYFSILPSEWPAVKAGLISRLAVGQ